MATRFSLALSLLLAATTAFAAPPTVTISGVVYDANNVASKGTRVTFKTVGIQTLPDKTVVPPTTFTREVDAAGTISATIPAQMVVEVQVGRSQPRTIYTGTVDTTLGQLLATYNPEIPVGNGTGGTTVISGGDSWMSFATETKISTGQTIYVSPGGAVSDTASDALFPAGNASWSSLSCVSTGGITGTATLYSGSCTGMVASSQTVSIGSSVNVSTGTAATTTSTQCVYLKIENTTGTGTAYINCAIKRTAS